MTEAQRGRRGTAATRPQQHRAETESIAGDQRLQAAVWKVADKPECVREEVPGKGQSRSNDPAHARLTAEHRGRERMGQKCAAAMRVARTVKREQSCGKRSADGAGHRAAEQQASQDQRVEPEPPSRGAGQMSPQNGGVHKNPLLFPLHANGPWGNGETSVNRFAQPDPAVSNLVKARATLEVHLRHAQHDDNEDQIRAHDGSPAQGLEQGRSLRLRLVARLRGDGAEFGGRTVEAGVELLEQCFGEAHRKQHSLHDDRRHAVGHCWRLGSVLPALRQQPLEGIGNLPPLDQVHDPAGTGNAALRGIAPDPGCQGRREAEGDLVAVHRDTVPCPIW
jgi:hypothetical protein